MTGKTHMLAGAAIGLTISSGLQMNTTQTVVLTGMTVLGSILPDIDQTNSKISNTNLLTKLTGFMAHIAFGHRGLTHTPFVLAIIAVLSWLISGKGNNILLNYGLFGLCIGIASHLLLDMFNQKGIPLLYPFSKKHFSVASVKERGIQEFVFCVLVVGITAGIWYIKGWLGI